MTAYRQTCLKDPKGRHHFASDGVCALCDLDATKAIDAMRGELEAFLARIDLWLTDQSTDADTLDALDDRAAAVRALLKWVSG